MKPINLYLPITSQPRELDSKMLLAMFARERGFLSKGNIVNLHNASSAYLKDFNDGKFGRITFEEPPE